VSPGATDAEKPVRVLHLTDPHLFADTDGELRGTNTYRSLTRVIDHYQAGNWRADIAIATGDLVQDDTAAAYRNCRQTLLRLDLPIYCLPGNHDVRELMIEELSDESFEYCPAREHGNWLLIGIDSCIEGRAGGAISPAELERFDASIRASKAPHVFACLHHPPVRLNSAWLDSVGLANANELLERATKADRVRLIAFGHAHQAYEGVSGDITILGTPSTCRQFLPGSDDFAVDDRPPAYRCITLHPDGTFATELVWLDEN
jgi:Icc protein